MNVIIEQCGDTANPWRARLGLSKGFAWEYPVQGQATEPGPWIEGRGVTPEIALAAAYTNLGRAAFLMSSANTHPVEPAK